jgi:glutathione S-transferase
MSITFYYAPMSSATRVHWALEEVGAPYEKVKVDLAAGDHKKPEYLKLNPNGQIPLIVVDGKPIFESLAQLLFIGETYGVDKGLFPKAGLDRAEAFKWMAWGSVSINQHLFRVIKNGERAPEDERNAHARAAACKDIVSLLTILDAHLAGREHVLDQFSLVDCALVPLVVFTGRLGIETSHLANLTAWAGRGMTRPALGRAMQG